MQKMFMRLVLCLNLMILCSSTVVAAQITFVRANEHTNANGGTAVSSSMAINAGDAIIVVCRQGTNTTAISSVTDSLHNTYNLVNQSSAGSHEIAMYAAYNVAASTNDIISCNFSSSLTSLEEIVAQEFSGVGSADGDIISSSGSNIVKSLSSGTITTTQSNDLLIYGATVSGSTETFTPGTGYTVPTNGQATALGMQYNIAGAAGAYSTSMSWPTLAKANGVFAALRVAGPPPAHAHVATPISDANGNLLPGWHLIFDDFDDNLENTLDSNKWIPIDGLCTGSNPLCGTWNSCYDQTNVAVRSGNLHLPVVSNSGKCSGYPFTSSGIRTGLGHNAPSIWKFGYQFGYQEARIYFPYTGTPPSTTLADHANFWTHGESWPSNGEADIAEGLLHGLNLCFSYHYGSSGNPIDINPSCLGGVHGWHVIGLLWNSGLLRVYYDGIAQGSVTSNVVANPWHVVLHLDTNSVMPVAADMVVDYVHVYSNSPNVPAVTPQPNYFGPGDCGGPAGTPPC